MSDSTSVKILIVFFRLTMAWTFLYAGLHLISVPGWSAAGFLKATKTFHDVYAPLTTPEVAPVLSFLVKYGHLLIGLSLLVGLMVRVSASFAVVLMVLYWTAHMNFPYIDNANNFLLDYHIVYAGVLVYLIVARAGHVWGLDAWAEKLAFFKNHPRLRPLVA